MSFLQAMLHGALMVLAVCAVVSPIFGWIILVMWWYPVPTFQAFAVLAGGLFAMLWLGIAWLIWKDSQ